MHESGDRQARRLRAVGDAPALDAGALGTAVEACVADARGGIAPRALPGAVADRLGIDVADVPARGLQAALGVLIATGRIDESGGRLAVAAGRQERRAG